MLTSNQIVAELLRRHPRISVLTIAGSISATFYEHLGELVCIGHDPPQRATKANDVRFIRATNSNTIAAAIARLLAEDAQRRFDLVYIDHDHHLPNILDQVRAALKVSREDTVFLFDDAVPPTIGMAGPSPSQAWWVGEVWMLKHLLQREMDTYFLVTSNVGPTGLLATAGFSVPDPAKIAETYESLSKVASDSELNAMSAHVEPEELLSLADQTLNRPGVNDSIVVSMGESDDPCISTEMIDESASWKKSAPSFILDLSEHGLDTSHLLRVDRKYHAKTIDTFSDVYLIGFHGIIHNGKYFDHKSESGDSRLDRVARAHGTYSNFETGIYFAAERYLLPRGRLEKSLRIEHPTILGTPDEPDNWGMWLLLTIPSLWEYIQNRERYSKFMAYLRHPWQRALLLELGLTNGDLVEQDPTQSYSFRTLTLVRYSFRDLVVTPNDREIFTSISDRIGGNLQSTEKIFVSRLSRTQKQNAYRGLVNESDLIEKIVDLGFTVVEPEAMSFPDQVRTFRSARVVVGLGGAGMFNTIFCRPRTKVVSIESTASFIDAHTNLFASMDLDFGVIFGSEDLTDSRPVQRRWSINVPATIEAIREFIS